MKYLLVEHIAREQRLEEDLVDQLEIVDVVLLGLAQLPHRLLPEPILLPLLPSAITASGGRTRRGRSGGSRRHRAPVDAAA